MRGHKTKPDTFSFRQSDAMPILIALHWLADGWKIYLFSRQLSLANNTLAVPEKLRGRMTPQDYDFVRRQSQESSTITILSVAILLLFKTFKLQFGYHIFIWDLTMHQAETQFWRVVLYAAYDALFFQLIVLPFGILATLMSPNSTQAIAICIVFFVKIIVATTSSAATIACLMMTIDFFGSSILLYFAPISNAAAMLLIALYILYFVPLRYYPIHNEASLQVPIKRLTNFVGYPFSKVYVDPDANAAPNAYFSGVLGTNMIAISQSLISMLDPQQLTAVVAHELGHWSKEHNIFHMFFSVLEISTLSTALAYSYDNQILMEIFGFGQDKPHAIITLYLWLAYLSPLIEDLLNGVRSAIGRLCEFYADDFASDVGLGLNLKTALLTLASKSTDYPIFDPLFAAWYLDHPPVLERVARIESH